MTASVEDPDIWVKQMVWLKDEIAQCKRRPNPPRWYIMLTHHGALTVTRMQTVQQMIPFVEDLGIHLVICGHHHSYSRSQPVKMNIRSQVEAITGHDLYDVYSGCGQAITAAVYSIGYLESFANKQTGVHEVPKGATYDQTTSNGTNEDGSQGIVTNGNEGSRQVYVNQQKGTYWVMCNATGSKLKSNKDLEKDPTPWWYGWAKYDETTGWRNNPHPYHPNYIMWDISYDSITLKSYVVEGIMEYDTFLKDAVVKAPDVINYAEMSKTLIDEFTIPWRDFSASSTSQVSESSEAEEAVEENATTEE